FQPCLIGMEACAPVLLGARAQTADATRTRRSMLRRAPSIHGTLLVVAPARPVSAARDRHEMRTDVDVDVFHVGIGHGAAIAVVCDQPLDDLLLAAICIEVDGIATGVL